MMQQLRVLAALLRTLVWFPAPTSPGLTAIKDLMSLAPWEPAFNVHIPTCIYIVKNKS